MSENTAKTRAVGEYLAFLEFLARASRFMVKVGYATKSPTSIHLKNRIMKRRSMKPS